LHYRDRILGELPDGAEFEPLMTLYLTDDTPPEEIARAKLSGHIHGVKLYPAGATTHSDAGVTRISRCFHTLERMEEVAMPMSELYLFGRVQDFGYEQAEPYAVVASRHHFRIWKAAFQWNGQDVWVGAGTHDIGFEKDQRNGKVTHKIDPAVDGERDNIGATLQKTDKVKTLTYYLPPDPVQDARNATGGGYHSDGRILVVQLQ
ncbi:MAG TPA: LssY C-terminal domain-containing protein, partial [Terriglobales bacterium]|nr:LssY C-terminal domain-containing protein [Terriglobales bacterium]